MMNEGRWPDLADDRAVLLRALSAYACGMGDAPMVCKWGTLAEVTQGDHEGGPYHEAGKASGELSSGTLTFVASTGAVDRHGDTVAPEGWRLDAYRENPVVLWAHDYRRPAIGRAQSVWRDGGALLACLEFADTDFAREVEGLYRQGYQQGVSVGFRPLRFEERRDARSGAFLGIRFLEQELLEISAVPVPANRGALLAHRGGVAAEVVGLLRGLRA
ncbi:MAG: HK97 family phage prohead protease [Chloroflexota bacterium]|nr:HK97 family phage prohead protease [Chloroflexota bacterium]MDE2684165.1 HK97 family phage prohead protease [Chloroflexota bacterium]